MSRQKSDEALEQGKRPRGRPRKYDFDSLEVGEFLFIAGKEHQQVAGSMAQARKRTGFRFFAMRAPGGVKIFRGTPNPQPLSRSPY